MRTFATVSLLFSLAAASEVHLADCFTKNNAGGGYMTSWMFFGSMNGQQPAGENSCAISDEGRGWSAWLWGLHECRFSTGVWFQATLNKNPSDLKFGDFAGTGTNTFEHFNCYRDDGHVIISNTQDFESCYSQYYCLS
ncbi:hypothetical protein GQ53DRAFT_841067 [Thozetella sp. PMI_491]|nr:hypothetical protein GQ53DRAFT_841067 [Thozetella sp. PMI_491]